VTFLLFRTNPLCRTVLTARIFMTARAGIGLLAIGFLLLAGCSHKSAAPELIQAVPPVSKEGGIVPGNQQWVDTGVHVTAGEAITVLAGGKIIFRQPGAWDRRQPSEAGPNGTFFFSDEVADKHFPLPSAAHGPAPCYCLMGRIGEGPPFYVGSHKSWVAEWSGMLKLGINDFDVADNSGRFFAQVTKPGVVQPVGFEEIVPIDVKPGGPVPGCSVVVFYIDGLRPDVVREMAAMGHIPHIRRLFVEGGSWLQNALTAFPSDTITSNGTMWTGCFSDRHGLKGQVRFSRRTLHSQSYLEPLGPNRSARLLAPQGIDKVVHKTQAASIKLLKGKEASHRWQQTNTTGVPPIYQHLRASGGDWATGVLPMMTEVPPLLWTRSMVRHLPYLRSQEGWKYMDEANAHYAEWRLLGRETPVTIIWLPETDSVSHKYGRGQFGMTRRTIAEADLLIGRIVGELQLRGRLQKTYLMLVSDHGHHGGRVAHLSHFDIANEFFYKPRQVSPDGRWIGGGLGLSVREHRFWNRHREDKSREFVFIDGDSDGVARIFLPRGHFRSGKWQGPHRPGDLLAYRIADHMPSLNLIESLTSIKAVHGDGSVQYPIDLVLIKLSEHAILIATSERGQAVIDRKKNARGKWIYKYTPVDNLRPTAAGQIAFRVVDNPKVDPLGLLNHLPRGILDYYLDEKTWLRMTAQTQYPDSVVTLTRHMLWQENLQHRETEFAPDLVVTAHRGWYFGHKSSPGTMHGYPFPDCMRATLFLSGPNIRRGARIEDPCRLVDLTPTLLEMVGTAFNAEDFDGTALRNIYSSDVQTPIVAVQPVYWRDVDLEAWRPLDYKPLQQYEHLPVTINQPSSGFDLNNMAYNVLSVPEWNVFRLFDDVLFPLSHGKKPVTCVVENADQGVRHAETQWIAEAAQTLDISGISLADYGPYSLGNLMRADRAIDWLQQRGRHLDESLAGPVGLSHLPGTPVVNSTVDAAQSGIWELYRFVQRVLVQILDETVLNGIENGVDRTINACRTQPAEVIVDERVSPPNNDQRRISRIVP